MLEKCKYILLVFQTIMRNLVRRYVTEEQRKADNQGVTEDDVNEIKQDISSFRYELTEILRNSGFNTSASKGQTPGRLLIFHNCWSQRISKPHLLKIMHAVMQKINYPLYFFTFFYILYKKKVLESWKFSSPGFWRIYTFWNILNTISLFLQYLHYFLQFLHLMSVGMSVYDTNFVTSLAQKVTHKIAWNFIFSCILT